MCFCSTGLIGSLTLFRLSLKVTATPPLQALICCLHRSLGFFGTDRASFRYQYEFRTLKETHLAFRYEVKGIFALRCWRCSESTHLTRAIPHQDTCWESHFDSIISGLNLLSAHRGFLTHSLALLTSSEKFNFSQLSPLCSSAPFCAEREASSHSAAVLLGEEAAPKETVLFI